MYYRQRVDILRCRVIYYYLLLTLLRACKAVTGITVVPYRWAQFSRNGALL